MIANLYEILYVLERTGTFACIWPKDSNAGKWKIILHNIRWTLAVINLILLMISLAIGIYHHRNDLVILMKTISEFISLVEVLLNVVLCRMNSAQLQILIKRVKMYLDAADEHENKVIQSYVDRYKTFYSIVAMAYFATGISFCLLPFFSKQELPADGWIPFSVEPVGIYCIVYVAQAYCVLQAAFSFSFDYVIGILFCFTAARLDVLGTKMKQMNCCDLLISCIKEHQEIIEFLENTKTAVQASLFKTNVTNGGLVICATFPLIYNQSLAVTVQFLSMVIAICGHMFLISWPADDLRESSVRFAISVNDIQWIGKRQKMTNMVLIVMQRSQKPFLITLGGLFPALSFEYYAQFLTTISSYFMAMRTMIES